MKVLMINGSPDPKGCIHAAMMIAKEVFESRGVECEEIIVGNKDIRGCIVCRTCKTNGKCVFHDLVNETSPKLKEADGLILGSPVYYGNPNGTLLSFVQRLFYSCGCDLHMKVGASIVSYSPTSRKLCRLVFTNASINAVCCSQVVLHPF